MNLQVPKDLKCEQLFNPLGVDKQTPRFSWIVEHKRRNQRQSAYQIIVSQTKSMVQNEVGDLWDSGRVESDTKIYVRYAGDFLQSASFYYWRVCWWNVTGQYSPYSEIAFFGTGLLDKSDWKAQWISKKNPEVFQSQGTILFGKEYKSYKNVITLYLRKEFSTEGNIRRATAYISGLGFYELHINGNKVGDRVLDPAPTDYNQIALYSAYDITNKLSITNSVCVLLGNGRYISNFGYGYPKLIVQIHIEYENGNKEIIVTDNSWKVSYGPLMENGLYYGERYDARQEIPGWDQPDFNDSDWEEADIVKGHRLASQLMPPIRVAKNLKPISQHSPKPGVYVFDFGQNFAGWVRLKICGPKGTEVQLRHAELLHQDGTLNTLPNQNAEATDIYVLKGEGVEIYEPRFTYHGFRYLEIMGYPGVPNLTDVEGRFVHSDVEKTGEFYCSNETINRIHRAVEWGQLSNLMGIPTDCPQRDERGGWMGDAHLSAEQAMFNFDMAAFYTKYLKDIQLAQRADGGLPDTVPPYIEGLYPADPAWGSAYITLAWYQYWFYGDILLLEEHYPSMRKYVEFLKNHAEKHILRKLGKFGDWCPPGSISSKKTTLEFTSTWFYYHDVLLLSRIAGVLENEEDSALYYQLGQDIKNAFNNKFMMEDGYASHRVSQMDKSTNQTSNVLPLYLNMVDEDKKQEILDRLLHSVIVEQDYHLDTGMIGTRYLLDVLTDNGYGEIAYKVATQLSYPGWGYMLEQGATTLWERWEMVTNDNMNSHNQIMFSSVDAWFYKAIAGIKPLLPAWRRIQVLPPHFQGLNYATSKVKTVQGDIRISWQRLQNVFELIISIPVGSQAQVYLPLLWDTAVVKEGSTVLWRNRKWQMDKSDDISFLEANENQLILETGSGYYIFNVEK